MSSLQRFLQSDECATPLSADFLWDSMAAPMYGKVFGPLEEDRCLQVQWREKYEFSTPRWNSPREEKIAVDQDSMSSGSVWSPQPSVSEYDTNHAPSMISPADLPGYEAHSNIPLCSGFSENTHCGAHNSFGYIAPSDVQQCPDLDADAEAETEDLSADPAQYYTQPAGDRLMKTNAALSLAAEDSGLGSSIHGTSIRSLSADEEDVEIEDWNKEDEGSDYHPPGKRAKANKPRRTPRTTRARSPNVSRNSSRKDSGSLTKPAKILKQTSDPSASTSSPNQKSCTTCSRTLPSLSSLNKHIMTAHTRPFYCTFARYGCRATFGAKNEWKRHVFSQHLRPGVYRCDMGNCVPQPCHNRKKSCSTVLGREGDVDSFNEFNRKDLFTQHIRRMHVPASEADKGTFKASLESIRERCWIKLHDTPPRSICGFCLHAGQQGEARKEVVFDGKSAWEDRMEHIGRHLEKGEKDEEEDVSLRDWMIREDLLHWQSGLEQYRVVGIGGKRNAGGDEDADGESA
ncbi:MAG: hypothetical protein Q9191_002783 [Dirinaria sp. TL-2023a]